MVFVLHDEKHVETNKVRLNLVYLTATSNSFRVCKTLTDIRSQCVRFAVDRPNDLHVSICLQNV